MKKITTLILLNIVLSSSVIAQSPYVIYYAVDELYTFTSQAPQNTITNSYLSYYNQNNGLVSNLRSSLYTSIDQVHLVDNEVKANYIYEDYGRSQTPYRASYRNDDMAYKRELVAHVRSTFTNNPNVIHPGYRETITTFDSDMPKEVSFTKDFSIAGINGSTLLTYGIKGTFAMVSLAHTYPKLVSPTDAQLPFVSTQFAVLSVPDFYRYFPEDQIGWYQDDSIIQGITGYILKFSEESNIMPLGECGLHSYKPYIKNPKFAFWTAGSIQIELSPNLHLGTDVLVFQPRCIEAQAKYDKSKYDGLISISDSVIERVFDVDFLRGTTNLGKRQLDKSRPSYPLSLSNGDLDYKFIEKFDDNRVSCPQTFSGIKITAPKPISIIDTAFNDILCYANKPSIDVNIDGNTPSFILAYEDSSKTLLNSQKVNIQLMNGSKTYNFQLKDDNGCIYEKPLVFKATEPDSLIAMMDILDATCHDGLAMVSLLATGGTPISKEKPYRYTFMQGLEKQDGYVSTSEIKAGSRLTPKIYDANQCSITLKDTVLFNPADFEIQITDIHHNICPKAKEGSIQIACKSIDTSYRYTYIGGGIQQQ